MTLHDSATIQFLGAAGTVTGSRYLVTWRGRRVLVDCGLFQGRKALRLRNWDMPPFDPTALDAVVVTHAHIDHTGYLPLLVRRGFRGPIHSTAATHDLCRLILPDAGHIQEVDAERANRYGYTKHRPALPLYTVEDAERSLELFSPHDFEEVCDLGAGLSLRFRPVGHILGAAQVVLEAEEGTLTFSGDVGRPNDPVMYPPAPGRATTVLVVESTYGGRLHPAGDTAEDLGGVVRRTAERGGAVLVPAFAVGRAHLLLYYLQRLKQEGQIPDVPVYLDSPMATSAMDIYCKHMALHRLDEESCKRTCNVAKYLRTTEESKALNSAQGPRIIVSPSGMLAGGRVLHHLRNLAPDPRNTLAFVGYQAPGTRGGDLLAGKRSVKVHGERVEVKAEVVEMSGLSAHADARELLAWLSTFPAPPDQTFVTHGEPEASQALCEKIQRELGWRVRAPDDQELVEVLQRPKRSGS